MKLSIVTISAFVGMLNEATKYTAKTFFNKDISKFIPMFSVLYGILLALVGFYCIPESGLGNDFIEAILIGISAGSASTGIHQIGHQISKNKPSEVIVEENATTFSETEAETVNEETNDEL